MYQRTPSLTIPPPLANPQEMFLKWPILTPPRAQRKSIPGAEKLCYGPIPAAIIFEKPAKRH